MRIKFIAIIAYLLLPNAIKTKKIRNTRNNKIVRTRGRVGSVLAFSAFDISYLDFCKKKTVIKIKSSEN